MTLDEARAAFLEGRVAVPALPIAGCIGWSVAALGSVFTRPEHHNLVLFVCFWAIFPLAALIARLRGERAMGAKGNPLSRLLNDARVMVLATWAIHLPVWFYAPALFPLTVGIAFGLHWVVFGWVIGHPIGFVHLGVRVMLVLTGWLLAPADRMGAVAVAVALSYALSTLQMSRMDWQALARPRGCQPR